MLLEAIENETLARPRWSINRDRPSGGAKNAMSPEKRLGRRLGLGNPARPKRGEANNREQQEDSL